MKLVTSILLVLSLLISGSAIALDIEKLFMPGDVIEGHKKLESDCKECHQRGREITQQELCANCHEKVKNDIQQKKGFHSKNNKAATSDCRVCHADHKGRDANIVWLDKDRFNHKQTDYNLVGQHLQTECIGCHKKDKKYREAPSACIDCHKDDDIHKNKLGEKCANCHNPKAWSSEQFDHDKTKFKLRHAHKKVSCDLCHVENKYKDTPKNCISCHAIKDVHKNRFGEKCQDCHTQKKWDESTFKHDRDTRYKIEGGHKSVTCHTCHTKKIKSKVKTQWKSGKQKIRNCYNCHKLDDVHKARNGEKCQDCHNQKSWAESSFDHDTKTEFALNGAHKKASCQACHQSDVEGEKTDKACYSCHKHKDVHKGQEGKECDNCHNDSSWWLEDVRYDHELTEFPLIGQHAVIGCESCHLSSAFKDAKSACNDCHQQDDVHEQALGTECNLCHNSNDWLIWSFDHAKTDFKIEGAHEELHCHSCHFKTLEKNRKKKSRCIDCHNRDDIHDGNFGPDCENCHTQDDFKTINIRSKKIFGR